MENIEISIEQLRVAKTHLNELLAKKKAFDTETNRLEALLKATQDDVDSCIKDRRYFIENGGDVFDPRAKKLRKQEQENSALIDDLVFAIETNRKAAESMDLDLSTAHNNVTGAKNIYVASAVSQLVAEALANPPVDLLKACHFATVAEFEDPFSFDVQALQVFENPTYKNMFIKKMNELLHSKLAVFASKQHNDALINDEEKTLLSVPELKEKLSPAQAHIIRASRNKKLSPGPFYGIQPWNTLENRQDNLVEA